MLHALPRENTFTPRDSCTLPHVLLNTLISVAICCALCCVIAIPIWVLWRRKVAIHNSSLLEDRCPYCNYDTSGVPDGIGFRRCPECGSSVPNFSDYHNRLDELNRIVSERGLRLPRKK